jgi:hypothetical protein
VAVGEAIAQDGQSTRTGASTRKIAARIGTSKDSVHRILIYDIGATCFRLKKEQRLTEEQCDRRFTCCDAFLERFSMLTARRIIFTDECGFYLTSVVNSQNDRTWQFVNFKRDVAEENLYLDKKQFADLIMVYAGVWFGGRTALYVVDRGTGIGAEYYSSVMLPNYFHEADQHFQHDNYVFQQDGAPAHRSELALITLTDPDNHVPDFITPEEWPSNSADLNPMDYCVWRCFKETIRQVDTSRMGRNAFIQVLQDRWNMLAQKTIDEAIDHWLTRCADVRTVNGGRIEHLYRKQ